MIRIPEVFHRYVLMNLDVALITEAREQWRWLIPESWEVLMITKLGDWFFTDGDGIVYFLDLNDASVTELRFTRDEILANPDMDDFADVLSVKLVDGLLGKGYWLEPDACFSYKQLPVIGGSLDESNIKVGFFRIYQSVQAQFHQQLRNTPPGSRSTGFKLEME